ncbi:adenylate/guanylate cyclase domain-containing protein [Ruegeria lacuscaerulensis]|uniref:adenylate/guanylate cyclase domain-containing protein n=1 Tax=Ruegeria lacuscaerulensis TaxID=55218 RepID=UPI00147E69A1|nr:adenylate/guanylate cyclase domain-containing protein [Ruegeria lacuscaerulensis]
MIVDMVGYSAMMSDNQTIAIEAVRELNKHQLEPVLSEFGGEVLKRMGDGWIIAFSSISAALNGAIQIQTNLHNHRGPKLRIGCHLGEIIDDDDDFYGAGVNITQRIQSESPPGGLMVSEDLYRQLSRDQAKLLQDAGSFSLKNIPQAMRLYQWRPSPAASHKHAEAKRASEQSLRGSKPIIVIAPFKDLQGEGIHSPMSIGIADELLGLLSANRWFSAISGTFLDANEQKEIGAKYVLDGSFLRAQQTIRISSRLLELATSRILHSVKLSLEDDQFFDAIDRIALQISGEITPAIEFSELQGSRKVHPSSLTAWELYLRAVDKLRDHTIESCGDAERMLNQSIKMEPDFAAAHARLASCCLQVGYYRWGGADVKTAADDALVHAQRALAADPNEPLGYDAMASVHQLSGDYESAASFASEAIALAPSCIPAHGTLITVLAFLGDTQSALQAYENIGPVAPRNPSLTSCQIGYCIANFLSGNFEEAAKTAKHLVLIRPNWYACHVYLLASLGALGRLDECESVKRRLVEIVPELTVSKMRARTQLQNKRDKNLLADSLRAAGLREE